MRWRPLAGTPPRPSSRPACTRSHPRRDSLGRRCRATPSCGGRRQMRWQTCRWRTTRRCGTRPPLCSSVPASAWRRCVRAQPCDLQRLTVRAGAGTALALAQHLDPAVHHGCLHAHPLRRGERALRGAPCGRTDPLSCPGCAARASSGRNHGRCHGCCCCWRTGRCGARRSSLPGAAHLSTRVCMRVCET